MTTEEIKTLAIELCNTIGNDREKAVELVNHIKIHYNIVQKKYGIKDACSWLNKADQEVVARNNYFYSAETNEVLIEVKLNEDGSRDKKTNGR